MDILTWCLGACVGARAGGASVLVLFLADLARDAPSAEGFPHSSSRCVFYYYTAVVAKLCRICFMKFLGRGAGCSAQMM